MIVGVTDGGFEGFNVGFWVGKFDGATLGPFCCVFIMQLLVLTQRNKIKKNIKKGVSFET